MRKLNIRGVARARAVLLGSAMALAALASTACQDSLLKATDPDLIAPSDLDTPEGADALRIGALDRFRRATGGDDANGNESTWLTGGLLADEWGTSSTFVQNDEIDERRIKTDNSTVTFDFRKLSRVRTAVDQALPLMKKYRADSTVNIAELYLARGFAEMQLASDFCNGIPLSDASNATSPTDITFGTPQTVIQVFTTAIKSLDSGYALLVGKDTASDVGRAIKVAKARALLGVNAQQNAAAAAALMNGIPTTFKYQHTYSLNAGDNAIWGQPRSGRRYNVGDSLEGNAHDILVKNNIPFFSSKDPRVPSKYTISKNKVDTTKSDTTKSQDGLTFSRTTDMWGQESPVDVANGIDARLIEAEAAFLSGNYATATTGTLAILNALRASSQVLTNNLTVAANALPALTDPGTDSARVAQLFREKAFWTFSRGERLGDLRRLIRQSPYSTWYNASNTFPSGTHYRGGTYGPDVNLPVPKDEEGNNPNITQGCIDRNA